MGKHISIITIMMAMAIVITSGITPSEAGFPAPPMPGINMPLPEVNVQVNGYLPAPPGVHVYSVDDRPYYVKNDRRVFLMEDHRHGKKYKKGKHHDNGYRDHGKGHGKNKHKD